MYFRLGLYLFTRVMKDGHDKRFKHIRNNPQRFMMIWTLQGIYCTLSPFKINVNIKSLVSCDLDIHLCTAYFAHTPTKKLTLFL